MKSSIYTVATRILAARRRTSDAVAAFPVEDAMVLVVADGAGNSAAGRIAADAIVKFVRRNAERGPPWLTRPEAWAELLARGDECVLLEGDGGQTTAVVVCIAQALVMGASVGDSEAWLQCGESTVVLTEQQNTKPLLGTGAATPVHFAAPCASGTVLMGTDGLFKYAPPGRIGSTMRGDDLERAAEELAGMSRTPGGTLPDDVGLALCRFGPREDSALR